MCLTSSKTATLQLSWALVPISSAKPSTKAMATRLFSPPLKDCVDLSIMVFPLCTCIVCRKHSHISTKTCMVAGHATSTVQCDCMFAACLRCQGVFWIRWMHATSIHPSHAWQNMVCQKVQGTWHPVVLPRTYHLLHATFENCSTLSPRRHASTSHFSNTDKNDQYKSRS